MNLIELFETDQAEHIPTDLLHGDGCSPCTSLCSSMRASVFFKQRNLLSPTQQDLPGASRGSASTEVLIQEKPPQFCQ